MARRAGLDTVSPIHHAINERRDNFAIASTETIVKLEMKMSVNSSNEEKPATPTCRTVDAEVACEECGKFGAYQIGDHFLCMDCYQGKGSCCPEFGKDDLTGQ